MESQGLMYNFTTLPHDPFDCQSSEHCYWHDVDEQDRDGDCLRCFECKHIYRSRTELEEAYAAGARDAGAPPGDDITFCPLCLHDF